MMAKAKLYLEPNADASLGKLHREETKPQGKHKCGTQVLYDAYIKDLCYCFCSEVPLQGTALNSRVATGSVCSSELKAEHPPFMPGSTPSGHVLWSLFCVALPSDF